MSKIKTIAFWFVVLLAIIMFSYNFYAKYQTDKEINKFNKETCWLWVLDEKGDGLGYQLVNNTCLGLKNNCEADYHDLNCKWIEGDIKGCECKSK